MKSSKNLQETKLGRQQRAGDFNGRRKKQHKQDIGVYEAELGGEIS
jgi:hypothetical protein